MPSLRPRSPEPRAARLWGPPHARACAARSSSRAPAWSWRGPAPPRGPACAARASQPAPSRGETITPTRAGRSPAGRASVCARAAWPGRPGRRHAPQAPGGPRTARAARRAPPLPARFAARRRPWARGAAARASAARAPLRSPRSPLRRAPPAPARTRAVGRPRARRAPRARGARRARRGGGGTHNVFDVEPRERLGSRRRRVAEQRADARGEAARGGAEAVATLEREHDPAGRERAQRRHHGVVAARGERATCPISTG
jgi:hypothetical protein